MRPVVAGVVPDADKALLHDILRPIPPASDTQREAKQFRCGEVIEAAQRLAVAQGYGLQQCREPVGIGRYGIGRLGRRGHRDGSSQEALRDYR
ncbi:hypothetical protein D3C72_1698370 [compost metagenome]